MLTLMLAVACFLGGWMANEWRRERIQLPTIFPASFVPDHAMPVTPDPPAGDPDPLDNLSVDPDPNPTDE